MVINQPEPYFNDDPFFNHVPQAPQTFSDALTRWQLDPEELLDRIERFLRRHQWDAEKRCYVAIPGVPPLANENGISTILAYLSSLLDPRSVTLSNFEDDDVRRLAKQARTAIRDIITLRYRDYGIDADYIPFIVYNCDSIIYGTLRRGFDEGERRFLSTTHQTIERRDVAVAEKNKQETEKRGFLFK